MDEEQIKLENLKLKKEMWEKAVDTQMHFNEMSVKSRQLGLTFVVAALGLAAVLISRGQGYGMDVFGYYVHVGCVIVLIGAIALFAVRTLDLKVYHRMLRGAVAFGEKLEDELRSAGLFGNYCGMTQSISNASRFKAQKPDTLEGDGSKGTAFTKISRFYNIAICVLLAIAVMLFLAFKDEPHDTKGATGKKAEVTSQIDAQPQPTPTSAANDVQQVSGE